MIVRFRERWEKLKESAKRKKEAKAAAEATAIVHERIEEEPEAEAEAERDGSWWPFAGCNFSHMMSTASLCMAVTTSPSLDLQMSSTRSSSRPPGVKKVECNVASWSYAYCEVPHLQGTCPESLKRTKGPNGHDIWWGASEIIGGLLCGHYR